ncbi:MAG: response regulator [Verrucomicrobia bacterium]|nr:response regulator [Verrucomicrobiota bacterium]
MSTTLPKICIADDDFRGRQLLADLLSPEGYQLILAQDGEEAVALALVEQPDLILLDVMMPKLNGYEVCRRLRADPGLSQVPILLLTALDDRRSRLTGLDAGADDFLSKPLDATELRTRVRTIIRLNRFRLLSEERERFATALALSPNAIVITSPDGVMHYRNAAFDELINPVQCPSVVSRNLFDAFPPETIAALRTRAAAVLAGGAAASSVETLLAGALRPETVVDVSVGRLPWGDGPALQFILRDVTEKKLLEAQLLRSQRIELLGQLAGGIVHDVNNILAAVLGSAQLIQMGATERAPVLLDNIQSSATRGVNLLRQLLMFARGSDEALVEVLPGGILAEVASVVRETLGRDYEVSLQIDDRCPHLTADPNQLHQVLMNLCVNARDAMPDGGKLLLSSAHRILSAADATQLGGEARAGEFVVLAVRDSGTGIPPHIKVRLFDPFFTTKPAGKGTGLGLATVLRLLRRHGGFVHLETEVGAGTCFHCYLPLQPPAAPPDAATAA